MQFFNVSIALAFPPPFPRGSSASCSESGECFNRSRVPSSFSTLCWLWPSSPERLFQSLSRSLLLFHMARHTAEARANSRFNRSRVPSSFSTLRALQGMCAPPKFQSLSRSLLLFHWGNSSSAISLKRVSIALAFPPPFPRLPVMVKKRPWQVSIALAFPPPFPRLPVMVKKRPWQVSIALAFPPPFPRNLQWRHLQERDVSIALAFP